MDELNESSYSAEVRGQFVLVNVAQGLSAEQPAIGLAQFAESIPHTAPDDASPTLEDAEPVAIFGPGTSFVPDSGEGIDAIALLLSTYRGSITNDIVADTTVGARTDWIVSFPLQGYRDYGENITTVNGEQRSCSPNVLGGDDPAFRFFLSGPWLVWGGGFVTGWTTIDFAPIPFVPWEPFLCYPVNTLTFGDGAPIFLDAENVLQSPPALGDGTLSLGSSTATVRYQFPDGFSEPGKNDGRPVVAYRVTTFINGTLANGSTLANYMFMRPHTVE